MEDILLGDDGDLLIENDDVVFGESTAQHQQLLIVTEKSAWKESPMVGVGARMFLENEDPAGLLNEVRKQFTTDGMNVSKINYDSNKKLIVEAEYK